MSDWGVVFLGIMAVALAVMAAIQIGLIVVGLKVARQLSTAIDDLRREIKPLSEKVNRIADEAARATSLARLQMERLDQVLATTADRIDGTLGILQDVASGPIRQGAAAVSAFRAIMSMIRDWKSRSGSSSPRDDDDALFVG